jgi:para-aminobenzoate synthetase component I
MTKDRFYHFIDNLIEKGAPDTPAILLESQLDGHPSSRYSIFATDPLVTVYAYGTTATIEVNEKKHRHVLNPWDALKKVRNDYPGWFIGYLGYDLKNHIENLTSGNAELTGTPDLMFFQPGTLLVYDRLKEEIKVLRGTIGEANELSIKVPGMVEVAGLSSVTGADQYLRNIEAAKELIREGEFYEINLSHVLKGRLTGNGFDLYKRMRNAGPVPFASYLRWRKYEVCCFSPERFLCRQGQRLFSQPIKGTAPRKKNEGEDEEIRNRLFKSEKNRAENLMIVDLVRHDLSKISIPGSVRVPRLFELRSFETVHQLISTVESRVEESTDPIDILKACFPMGSMTGAPKIRSMQAIEELEDYKRGIYSGAIGYIRPDNNFDFNVVIRTAILNQGDLYYPVGGAITSDSEPSEELEETIIKARALTNVVEMQSSLK